MSTTVAEDNPLDTEVRDVHPLVRLSPHYYNTEAEIDSRSTGDGATSRALDRTEEAGR